MDKQGNVYRGTGFAPGYSIVSTRKVAEPKRSLVQGSEVDEEMNEIALVHCENKVFEYELCNPALARKPPNYLSF